MNVTPEEISQELQMRYPLQYENVVLHVIARKREQENRELAARLAEVDHEALSAVDAPAKIPDSINQVAD